MRRRFLTVTVAIVLIGLVSGQFQFRYGNQFTNFASSGPQPPVNPGNLQNFPPDNYAFLSSNKGSGTPLTNAQPNPLQYAASGPVPPHISNQPPINNMQYANSFSNPIGSLSPLTGMIEDLIENNPFLEESLGLRKANHASNGAHFIQNSQNGFPNPYITGSYPLPNANLVPGTNAASVSFSPQISNQPQINNWKNVNSFTNPTSTQLSPADLVMNSLKNDPFIKQYLPGPSNSNPVASGDQLTQNYQNGFPVSYVSGSKGLPNVNPSYKGPESNAAGSSFFSQINNQPLNNNFQYGNSFTNPVGLQPLLAGSKTNFQQNNPLIRQYLARPTNANHVASGPQLTQNSQNGFPVSYVSGSNVSPYVNPSYAKPASNAAGAIFFPQINNQYPNNNFQYANSFTNPGGLQPLLTNSKMNSQQNNPLIRQYFPGPANLNPVANGVPFTQNSQNGFPGPLPNGPYPLFNINPSDTVQSSSISNSDSSTDNYSTDVKVSSPNGNRPTSPPTVSIFGETVGSSNNPTPSDVPTFPTSMPDKTYSPSSSVLNPANNLPNYSLPSDVPIEYPKSDFPDGFLLEMLKSLENDTQSTSTVAAIQPKKRRKCKVPRSRTGVKKSSKSPVTANTESSNTGSASFPSNNVNLFTLNNIRPVNQVSDSTFLDSPQADFKFTTEYPYLATTPPITSTESVTIINTINTNQNPDLSMVSLSSVQTKKKCNKTQIKPKVKSENLQKYLSQADSKFMTIYPPDILKQYILSNIKKSNIVKDSMRTSKAPSVRKRKCRKQKKVYDSVPKEPNFSDFTFTSAMPQTAGTEIVTAINTKNTNQNSDFTTVALSSLQPKKKKKCNKTPVKPKAESGSSQIDLGPQSYIFPSFIRKNGEETVNLSQPTNNGTDSKKKSKKCQRKKERLKAPSTKGLTTVSSAGPTDAKSVDNTKQDSTTTDSWTMDKTTDKVTTTVGPVTDLCEDEKVWWNCMPLNNTCTNFARGKSQKNFICEPGCFCPLDLVQDVNGKCVDPEDCADPVCIDEDHEEITDCLIECNRCEDDCHPCQMQSCVSGCDCEDGYKRNDNGTCVLDMHCPPCPPKNESDSTAVKISD